MKLVMAATLWYPCMQQSKFVVGDDGWKSLVHQNKLVKLAAKVLFRQKNGYSGDTLTRKGDQKLEKVTLAVVMARNGLA